MIQDEDFHNMGGCVRGRALWRGIDEEIESFFFFLFKKCFSEKKKAKNICIIFQSIKNITKIMTTWAYTLSCVWSL